MRKIKYKSPAHNQIDCTLKESLTQGGRWCCPESLSRGLTCWLLHSLGEAYVKIGWKPISCQIKTTH